MCSAILLTTSYPNTDAELKLIAILLLQPPSFGITGIRHHAQLKILLENYFFRAGETDEMDGSVDKGT